MTSPFVTNEVAQFLATIFKISINGRVGGGYNIYFEQSTMKIKCGHGITT